MAIRGRRPTEPGLAALLEVKNNRGELVAGRRTEQAAVPGVGDGSIDLPELRNSRAFTLQEAAKEYFEMYVDSKPKGYWGQSDVPGLEKLCLMLVMYDKAMLEYMDRPSLMRKHPILGIEETDPYFKVMDTLTSGIARYMKFYGLSPLDRGRPIVDEWGRPVVAKKPILEGEAEEVDEDSPDARKKKFLKGVVTRRIVED